MNYLYFYSISFLAADSSSGGSLFKWFDNLSEKIDGVVESLGGIFKLISTFAVDSLSVFNALTSTVGNLPTLFAVCIPAPLLVIIGTFVTLNVIFRILGND